MVPHLRVSVVASGLEQATWRLQPWRYLWELGRGLSRHGHDVEVLSEKASGLSGSDASVTCIDVAFDRRAPGGRSLASALSDHQPEVTLWNIGATSALTFRPVRLKGMRNVAVLTSPRYGLAQMLRLAPEVLREPSSYGIHAVGSLISERRLARYLRSYFVRTLVPGQSFRDRLLAAGLRDEEVSLVVPGRDQMAPIPARGEAEGGLVTFLFAGSPGSIRGADLAIRALAGVVSSGLNVKMIVLSRIDRPDLHKQSQNLVDLAAALKIEDRVEVIAGVLDRERYLLELGRADVITLPFRLVPSASPLVILEASGAGKPLIATRHACISDLASPGAVLVSPDDGSELTRAMVRMASDQGERQRLGSAARRWFEDWPTWDRVARTVDDVVIDAAQRPSPG